MKTAFNTPSTAQCPMCASTFPLQKWHGVREDRQSRMDETCSVALSLQLYVRAQIVVTWGRCNGQALVYVQSMAALLLESRPKESGLQESWLFAAAASRGAFSHSPIHWERLSLWEATKSLVQTPPQLPLQWMQGRRRA